MLEYHMNKHLSRKNKQSMFNNMIILVWIEFDFQQTKVNVLFVFHDETVDRSANEIGRVESHI